MKKELPKPRKTQFERIKDSVSNHRILSVLTFLGVVTAAIASFTDNISKIESSVRKWIPSRSDQLVATIEVKNIGPNDVDIEPYCEFFITAPPVPAGILNYPTGRARLTPLSDRQHPYHMRGSESKRYPRGLAY